MKVYSQSKISNCIGATTHVRICMSQIPCSYVITETLAYKDNYSTFIQHFYILNMIIIERKHTYTAARRQPKLNAA